jgi:MoxR-like ATPase
VSFDDLRAVLLPVMRHRVKLNYEGEAERIDIDALLQDTLETEAKLAA